MAFSTLETAYLVLKVEVSPLWKPPPKNHTMTGSFASTVRPAGRTMLRCRQSSEYADRSVTLSGSYLHYQHGEAVR